MSQEARNGTKAVFQRMQLSILLMYIVIIILMAMTLSTLLIGMSNSMLSEKVSAFVSSGSRQTQIDVNSYLSRLEKTSDLLSSNKDYYEYDPSKEEISGDAGTQREKAISDRIHDIAVVGSFADLVIVYSTGKRLGFESGIFGTLCEPEEMYSAIAGYLEGEDKSRVWASGFGGLTDRLFCFKRLSPGAILVMSFYTTGPGSSFEYPGMLRGMRICLADEENRVLYSTDHDMIGEKLPAKVIDAAEGRGSRFLRGYYISVNTCENGWRAICYVDRSDIYRDMEQKNNLAIVLSVLFAAVFSAIGMFVLSGITGPVDVSVAHLEEEAETDSLSGLLNKLAFQDKVSGSLKHDNQGAQKIFMMMDMDNFKLINDIPGHDYGDGVIARMGSFLRETFGERFLLGRIGGDEFALYGSGQGTREEVIDSIRRELDAAFAVFDEAFAAEKASVPISLSIGIDVESGEVLFPDMYHRSDSALYASKRGGKNGYTFYHSADTGETEEDI